MILRLSDLSNNEDVWENICSWLSGESLHLLAAEPALSAVTRVTPAFVFLSGLNNIGHLVPWIDADNVLSPRFQPHRVANVHSELLAVCSWALRSTQFPLYAYQLCVGGPARPSTPSAISLPMQRQRPKMMLLPHKSGVAACLPKRANPSECWESYSAPVFGVRPGFSYPPFWDLLVGDSDSD